MSVGLDPVVLEALEELLTTGELPGGPQAQTVGQAVIIKGYASLSRKQRFVYDAVISPAVYRRLAEIRDRKAGRPPQD